jgi:predicted nucleic acid-binding protein
MSAAAQLGWLDTNIFVHALFPRDPHYQRCQPLLGTLDNGAAEGWLDILVVHELTYVLGRLPAFADRAAIERYLRSILLNKQIRADDKPALLEAVARWAAQGVGFADAWLAVLAQRRGLPVRSVNTGDFPDVGNTFPA